MREVTVRIRFTKHCLGNAKERVGSGRFLLPRNPQGQVTFLASWHHSNLRFAANLLGKHQDEVGKILWDIAVDGLVHKGCWVKRYYSTSSGRQRYVLHEAFMSGQVVGINCVVPTAVSDEDLWRLMSLAGQYKGLSPWQPGEFGFYEVESIRPRRTPRPGGFECDSVEEGEKQKELRRLPLDEAPSSR